MHRSPLLALGFLVSTLAVSHSSQARPQTFEPPQPPMANSCSPFENGVWFDGMCVTHAVARAVFGLNAPGVTDSAFGFCTHDNAIVDGCALVAADLPGIGFQRARLMDVPCASSNCVFGYQPQYTVATEHSPLEPAGEEVQFPSVSLEIVKAKAPYFYKDYNKPKPMKEIKLGLPKFKPGFGPPKPDDKPKDKTAELSFLSVLTYDPSVFPGRPDDLVYQRSWTVPFDPYLGVTDTNAACAVAAARVRGLMEEVLQELTLECQTFAPFSSSGLVQLPEYLVSFEHGGQLQPVDACDATQGFFQHELIETEARQLQQCLADPGVYFGI